MASDRFEVRRGPDGYQLWLVTAAGARTFTSRPYPSMKALLSALEKGGVEADRSATKKVAGAKKGNAAKKTAARKSTAATKIVAKKATAAKKTRVKKAVSKVPQPKRRTLNPGFKKRGR